MTNGRPLRFLLVTLAGWTALRVAMLWPAAVIAPAVAAGRTDARAQAGVGATAMSGAVGAQPTTAGIGRKAVMAASPVSRREDPHHSARPDSTDGSLVMAAIPPARVGVPGALVPPTAPIPRPASSSAPASRPRLAGSAWLIARGGSDGTLLGGQLGGSQAGVRLTYALGSGRRVALAARVASPLSGRGREAALGVEWRPTAAPVRIVAEQRLSLDGGQGGPTLMAVGGIDPTPVAAGFRLEGYAQAGVIARDGVEGFGDGAVRLARRMVTAGRVVLDAGAGGWGAAQRGARRLDVGPTLGLVVPVGPRSIRLTLDYRTRIAGDAHPGSGPALSIGSDF